MLYIYLHASEKYLSFHSIYTEVQLASRKALYEIKQLENELPRYQAIVENITGK